MARNDSIEEKLKSLPTTPGVYLMKDSRDEVIYVGKAASLRSRVRSYFQAQAEAERRTQSLVAEIDDFDVIQTQTESEAFLLEDSLVKRHQPRFNARLRDDKRYPYLKITAEPFPRVMVVRRRLDDGARYFGPYTNAKAMRATLKLAQKLFPIRTCTLDLPLKTPRRPCLNHHIGRCLAPCAELVSIKEYDAMVDRAAMLFEGRVSGLISGLRQEMRAASEAQRFERAAHVRDQMESLERSLERQSVVFSDTIDRDVLGLAVGEGRASAQVFLVRGGRMAGRESYHLRVPDESSESEILSAFLTQYYANASSVPREILLPLEIENPDRLEVWLTGLRGRRVHVRVPQRGEKRGLVELASDNARFAMKGEQRNEAIRKEATAALVELAEALSLSVFPQRIEAFDISNTQGGEATGSMVVFENGSPRRDAYRRFRIQQSGKPDDYAMMAEVLIRRFRRGLAELSDPSIRRGRFSEFPELLLIDGGKGQLNVAVEVLRNANIEGIEVIGLAKRHEEVFRPSQSEPLVLDQDSPALLLLRRIRDEAHRFAVTYHRKLRAKRSLASALDEIRGIGPKRKSALIKGFGSVARISHASAAEIAEKAGIPVGLAEQIRRRLRAAPVDQ
jgi:excinuclease ABC subunit C